MKRHWVPLLGLLALSLTALPGSAASVDGEASSATSTGLATTDASPEQVTGGDVRVALDVEEGGDSEDSGPLVALGPKDHVAPAASADPFTDLPDPSTATGAAAAATGLAVTLGLVTYYWGQVKVTTLGAVAPLFSRIRPHRMLENDVRNRVHQAVVENPGISQKEIVGLCGIGWGTAVYHLKRLETERLVVSERHRQFRRFYKNGGGVQNAAKSAFAELKNPTGQRIAASILAEPGRCQKEVCQNVGISPPLAHKYLSRLEEAGLVSVQRDWKLARYFPTAQLGGLMAALRPMMEATSSEAPRPLEARAVLA